MNNRSWPEIFLEDPKVYWCQVYTYMIGHSVLTIQASSLEKFNGKTHKLYMTFYNVRYYSGPFSWIGASIVTAPHKDCLELARSLDGFDLTDDVIITTVYKLYMLGNIPAQISIIGSSFEIKEKEIVYRIAPD